MPQSLTLGISFETPDQASAYYIGVKATQEIQKQLSGQRHGRWYPAPGNKWYATDTPKQLRPKNYFLARYHGVEPWQRDDIVGAAYQASAPGESPAVRTGRLRQSFFMTVSPKDANTWVATIRTNVAYADDLEFGTLKINPRPFVTPVVHRLMPEIIKMRIKGTLKALKRKR